jgi:hypothetical protein
MQLKTTTMHAASAATCQALRPPKPVGSDWTCPSQKKMHIAGAVAGLAADASFLAGLPEPVRLAREAALARLLSAVA